MAGKCDGAADSKQWGNFHAAQDLMMATSLQIRGFVEHTQSAIAGLAMGGDFTPLYIGMKLQEVFPGSVDLIAVHYPALLNQSMGKTLRYVRVDGFLYDKGVWREQDEVVQRRPRGGWGRACKAQ